MRSSPRHFKAYWFLIGQEPPGGYENPQGISYGRLPETPSHTFLQKVGDDVDGLTSPGYRKDSLLL